MTKSKSKNQITKKDDKVPAFLKESLSAPRGAEEIGSEDLIMPRVHLIQEVSNQVADGGKVGEWYHDMAEQSLGQTLKIVPVIIKQQFFLFNPRHEGGGLLARADDGIHWVPSFGEFKVKPIKGSKEEATWKLAPSVKESGLAEWGSSNPNDGTSPPAAIKVLAILAYLPDFPDLSPVVISAKRSSLKAGRALVTKIKMSGRDSFAQVYELEIFDDSSNEGDFKNFRARALGFVDEETYRLCEDLWKGLHKKSIKYDVNEGEDAPADASTDEF